tara:strand:- start:206 stop:391 length:186 start_codon:yes stop_codon:yes gene_type:complete
MPKTKEERREAQRLAKRRSRAKQKAAGIVEVDKRTAEQRRPYFKQYRREERARKKEQSGDK